MSSNSNTSMRCIKCETNVTYHRSGVCAECRQRKCPGCNKTFIPKGGFEEKCFCCNQKDLKRKRGERET